MKFLKIFIILGIASISSVIGQRKAPNPPNPPTPPVATNEIVYEEFYEEEQDVLESERDMYELGIGEYENSNIECAIKKDSIKDKMCKKRQGKLKAMRVAHLTNLLDLSPSEAEKFWPIFNEYDAKKSDLRKSLREERAKFHENMEGEKAELTEEQAKLALDEFINSKTKEIELAKSYQEKFLTVLSAQKTLKLFTAEHQMKNRAISCIKQLKQRCAKLDCKLKNNMNKCKGSEGDCKKKCDKKN